LTSYERWINYFGSTFLTSYERWINYFGSTFLKGGLTILINFFKKLITFQM